MSPKEIRATYRSVATACLLLIVGTLSSEAAIVAEFHTDRATFEARLGTVNLITFDDVDTGASDPASFAADRYLATQGMTITGEAGQYASRDFGYPSEFPPISPYNS